MGWLMSCYQLILVAVNPGVPLSADAESGMVLTTVGLHFLVSVHSQQLPFVGDEVCHLTVHEGVRVFIASETFYSELLVKMRGVAISQQRMVPLEIYLVVLDTIEEG
jgi:hypothetical protein